MSPPTSSLATFPLLMIAGLSLLTSEQTVKYEAYLTVRDEMAGSSRDVKEIRKTAE